MKNLSTTLQQTAPGDLKLAWSKAMDQITKVVVISNRAKESPYRSLFNVHPVVQLPEKWDANWFGNYE